MVVDMCRLSSRRGSCLAGIFKFSKTLQAVCICETFPGCDLFLSGGGFIATRGIGSMGAIVR